MIEYTEFNEKGEKLYLPKVNKIACKLAKLLRSPAKIIKNQTGLSHAQQLDILERFNDKYKTARGRMEKALLSGETKWREYLTKTNQWVPNKASRTDMPRKLDKLRKQDSISYENVETISSMLDTDPEGLWYVSRTTPGYLLPAIWFDKHRKTLGFKDIDTRIQEHMKALPPAPETTDSTGGIDEGNALQPPSSLSGIEEHTPVLSTAAVSTGHAAPASGGSSTEGRGVAQQLKKSGAPTGDTSPSKRKRQDEGDGDEGWFHRPTVELMRGFLESYTNPQGFLDYLETYEGGQICEKMFDDSGIKGRLWEIGTYKKGPIVGRAVRLWDKLEETAYDQGWYSKIAVSLLRGCSLSDHPKKFLDHFAGYPDGKISKKVFIEAGIKKTLCRLEKGHDRAIAKRATELRRKWKTEEVERRKKIPRT